MRLKDLAEIRLGYQFRGKIQPDSRGTHQVIQIKDFDEKRNLILSGLVKIKPDRDPEKYLVEKRDVLFLSRGHRNFAVTLKHELKNTIVVSYFLIIRIKEPNILPEYLAWYLNQRPAQNFIQRQARRGTHIPIVPKSAFEKLKIEIPSLSVQKAIVTLEDLRKREQLLLHQLEEERDKLIRSTCLNASKGQTQPEGDER